MTELENTKKLIIDDNAIQDVHNIINGTYRPLAGFLKSREYRIVLDEMHSGDGSVWSIPIILDIKEKDRNRLEKEEAVLLVDERGQPIALMTEIEIYPFDKREYAEKIYGTLDIGHPGVYQLKTKGDYLLGGRINGLSKMTHSFMEYYKTPDELREFFREMGWKKIVAFQTRNIPHRSHEYLQMHALEQVDGLLVQPVIGQKKSGDFRDDLILQCYKTLFENYYPKDKAILSVLPIRMHYAGPREALHHAVIRRNFGCTHMIIGRDHAGVGGFYHPLAAHEIFDRFNADELGIEILKLGDVAHCRECGNLNFKGSCGHAEDRSFNISGTKVREMVRKRENLPEELVRPEISRLIINHNNPFVE